MALLTSKTALGSSSIPRRHRHSHGHPKVSRLVFLAFPQGATTPGTTLHVTFMPQPPPQGSPTQIPRWGESTTS